MNFCSVPALFCAPIPALFLFVLLFLSPKANASDELNVAVCTGDLATARECLAKGVTRILYYREMFAQLSFEMFTAVHLH